MCAWCGTAWIGVRWYNELNKWCCVCMYVCVGGSVWKGALLNTPVRVGGSSWTLLNTPVRVGGSSWTLLNTPV